MTRDDARKLLADDELRRLIVRVAERFTDLALGPEPPVRLFRETDDRAGECIEEALVEAAVDVPRSVGEWQAEYEADRLVDIRRDAA